MTGRISCALAIILSLAGCRAKTAVIPPDPSSRVEVVLPEHGAYTGAFMDFGDAEDEVTIETIEEFENMVGKHQAIIASSSYWGEQSFPTRNLNVIWRHGSMPLVFWSPWDRPYTQNRGPDKFSLNEIIAGKCDAYIDKWGESAREFGQPMVEHLGEGMKRADLGHGAGKGDIDVRQRARFFFTAKTLRSFRDRGSHGGSRFVQQFPDNRFLFLAERFHSLRPRRNAAGAAEIADTRGFERLLVGRGSDFSQRRVAQLFQLVRHSETSVQRPASNVQF